MVAPRARPPFTLDPRNPREWRLIVGEGHILFGNVSSPPNAWDLERGKRPGDFETYRESSSSRSISTASISPAATRWSRSTSMRASGISIALYRETDG